MSDTPDTITIDGFGPLPVARPASAAELGDLVRRCAAEGRAVYPVGGGTMLDYGLPPSKPGLAIDTRSLDQVVDYPARDMTITVQAGITIARLREVTRAEGLDLPIDVPDPERATLGGAIACNVSGPRRYGYGTFRDYVLGITTVNDRGEAVSAGGRVVKNVAGYDLMKLHTGALGTLGVITQVTLKLRPVPEERAVVGIACSLDRLPELLDRIYGSLTRPVAVDFLDRGAAETLGLADEHHPWAVTVGFDGSAEAVDWQVRQVQSELAPLGMPVRETMRGRDTDDYYRRLAEAPKHPKSAVIAKATMPSSRVAAFVKRAHTASESFHIYAHAGSGIVYLSLTSHYLHDTDVAELSPLLDVAAADGGNLTIRRCFDPAIKKALPVWGRPPSDLALQKAVKRALDPANLFNPGRFVTDT